MAGISFDDLATTDAPTKGMSFDDLLITGDLNDAPLPPTGDYPTVEVQPQADLSPMRRLEAADFSNNAILDVAAPAIDAANAISPSISGLGAGILQGVGVDTFKDVGTPEARAVGTAAVQAAPFGAGMGFATAMAGKTKFIKDLAASGKKFIAPAARVVKEAGESPTTATAMEAYITALAVGGGEAAKQQGAGVVGQTAAELGTALIAPATIPKKLFDKAKYLAEDVSVDTVFAGYLRQNPAILQEAEDNIATFTAAKIPFRLQHVSKDPHVQETTQILANKSPELSNLLQSAENEVSAVVKSTIDGLQNGSMTPAQASRFVDDFINKTNIQADAIALNIPDPSGTVAARSMEFFDAKIQTVHDTVQDGINEAYSLISPRVPLPDKGRALKEGFKEIITTESPSGAAYLNSGAKPHIDNLLNDFNTKGFVPNSSQLNEIRGNILKDIRRRNIAGEPTDRLSMLERNITEYLDEIPELGEANTLYRTFKQSFDKGFLAQFFKRTKTQDAVTSTENFYKRMMAGSPVRNAKQLREFVDTHGAKNGTDWADVQTLAKDSMMLSLREKDLTAKSLTSFVNKNRETLNAYGIADDFKDIVSVKRAIETQKDSISDKALNKLLINRYGVSQDPTVLRKTLFNNKVEYIKNVNSLPQPLQEPFRKATAKAVLFDDFGEMLPLDKVNKMLSLHGDALNISKKNKSLISATAAMLRKPDGRGVTFSEFDFALKKNPEIFDKIKSIALERITRLPLKVIRGTSSSLEFLDTTKTLKGLQDALLTEDGARRVVELAKKSPQSRLILSGLLYGRAAAITQINEGEQ